MSLSSSKTKKYLSKTHPQKHQITNNGSHPDIYTRNKWYYDCNLHYVVKKTFDDKEYSEVIALSPCKNIIDSDSRLKQRSEFVVPPDVRK